MHQRGTVGSVGHLATCVITVAPGTKADEAVAKITKRLKSGKVVQDVGISIGEGGSLSLSWQRVLKGFCSQEEVFSIQEDFTVALQGRTNQARPKHAEPEEVPCYTSNIIRQHAEAKCGQAECAAVAFYFPADGPGGQLDLQPPTV